MNAIFLTLLTLLGSDKFDVRQSADAALRRSLPLSLPWIEAGARSKDAEVRCRCGTILGVYYYLTVPAKARTLLPDGFVVLPRIANVSERYLTREEQQRYREKAEKEVQSTGQWGQQVERHATYLWMCDWLQERENLKHAQVVLDIAAGNERAWHAINPKTTVPDSWSNVPTRLAGP